MRNLPSGPVRNVNTGLTYNTIQAAIDANETLDGHTISVRGGIYNGSVVVDKAVALIGENENTTIIDGKGQVGINVNRKSATIKGFTIRNCSTGIYLKGSNNSLIAENKVSLNTNAILVYDSVNLTINQNIAGNNDERGILVTRSENFTVSSNVVFKNGLYMYGYGINANSSANGLIKQNTVYGNSYDGIGLLDSDNCKITENTVANNTINGILLDSSSENSVYHNNIIDNGVQAVDIDITNQWDDGVEGNYWSNYAGADSNHDGIGDTPQNVFGSLVQDTKPLMGLFYSFTASTGYQVNIISNSTVTDFAFATYSNTITIHVANVSALQSFGFCRLAIPKALIAQPYTVEIDDGSVEVLNFNMLLDNGTYNWIYFAYSHSTRKVDIVGTSP